MKEFDFVIVGAGLFGATFARQVSLRGMKCLVIDKRPHAGGNIYCRNEEGINIHQYGAHIFHTNDKPIWEFVNSFVEFNRYTNSPMANYKGTLYNLPFNMNTFNTLWGVHTPEEARSRIDEQISLLNIGTASNLEEQALKLVGTDIYEKLIKGYTEKQWGRKATDLPAFIIKRLPVRFTYDNNYFNDKYQGIPAGGYNKLTDGLLKNIEVRLGTDYFSDRDYFHSLGNTLVFTGAIDEYFNNCYGALQYRSLRFEDEFHDKENYQGNAVVNYTASEIPYTRIIEHKHFEFGTQPVTIITREYPQEWKPGLEKYYPVNDDVNNSRFKLYQQIAALETNVLFGGRLAEYQYYDMHQVIGSAMAKAKKIVEKLQ